MRRIGQFLLVAILPFMLGCGGRDQPGASGGPGDGGTVVPAGYGLIKIDIRQGNTGTSNADSQKLALVGSLPTADQVRIAARLITTRSEQVLDDNGSPLDPPQFIDVTSEFYRKIVDVALPTTGPVSVAVPAADGYTVEVLSSVSGRDSDGNPIRIMLKYGKVAGLNVTPGVPTSTSITTNPIADGLTIAAPDNVAAGNRFTVPIAIADVPLRKSFYFQQYVDNVSNTAPSGLFVNTSSPWYSFTPSFTAPSLTSSPPGQIYWDLYLQGLFFIDYTWQSETDKSNINWWKQWVFYYPNTNTGYGDPHLTMRLYPLGTMDIIVILSQ